MSQDPFPFETRGPAGPNLGDIFRKYGKLVVFGVVAIILIAYVVAGVYQVEPDSVGVETRFGRFKEITDPGLGWRWPLVEELQKVEAKRQLKLEFGFRTESAGVQSAFRRDPMTRKESTMLTGDLNVAVVEWIVHYQISDPYKFLFKVRNTAETLRDLSEATMREVVGDYSVTEVLTRGREKILEDVKVKLAEKCNLYEGRAGARPAAERGLGPVQQGDPPGPGPGAADDPGGRGLRRGAGQPVQGRRGQVRGAAARVQGRAPGHAHPNLPRDLERDPAQGRTQDLRRRGRQGHGADAVPPR
jgi:hypothetical protein